MTEKQRIKLELERERIAGMRAFENERIREMLDCAACDDALRILQEENIFEETLTLLTERIAGNLRHRAGEELEAGVLVFSNVYGILGETENARDLLKKAMEG